MLDAVQTANSSQEKRRASAPVTTKERNQAARRIRAAVARIAGAGLIEFAQSPKRADFEALLEGPRRAKSAPKSTPAAA